MLITNYIAVCEQCKDEEPSARGESLSAFLRRLGDAGWVLPFASGEHYCSPECRNFDLSPSEDK